MTDKEIHNKVRDTVCQYCGNKYVSERGLKIHLGYQTQMELSVRKYRKQQGMSIDPNEIKHI